MRQALHIGGIACLAVLLSTVSGCSSSSSNGTTADGGTGDGGGGGGGVLPFTPSNIDISGVDLSKIDDIDITASPCAINSEMLDSRCFDPAKVAYTTITQPNQIKIGVYVAKSWRIEPNAVVTIFGSFPIVLVATGGIDILGSLSAAASGDNPVGGGYRSVSSGSKGAGPGGGGAGSNVNAGGGASYCGIGGTGGVGAGGTATAGGAAYGAPTLIPLEGGSQGGGGGETDGGAGGGAIQLVAGTTISIEAAGLIHVGGGHGNYTGGGGGSGGAILLEAPSVTVAGTLAANGGGGQAGPTNPSSDASGSDQPAAGSAAAAGLTAAGGNGSAGANVNGANGGDGDMQQAVQSGGGGGGAGFIRINTTSGSATITGTLSPSAASSCMSQGAVK